MQLLSKYNKRIRFLLCVIDIFSKYAWVVPLKDISKGVSIVTAFQSILKQSNRKPNKIWVDKGSEFYNASFKKWLQDNDIVMYSTNNEGKSVVAERFIRTLKSNIYKYMTSISKNVYINKLDDIVDDYNNTYHTTIKMKPIDVKDNTYINTDKETDDKDPKYKVGDRVRISKYKNIFAKGYTPNWSEEVFVIKKVKNTVPWSYVINDLNGEEIMGTFYEKELQKTSQEEFRIEKVIKRKGDKMFVKWKGYDNSFNSWIDKKRSYKMSQYFPPYNNSNENIKVELDLSNYATKKDIKDITRVDTSSYALKTNLAALKTEVDNIDTGKLKTVPNDLAKLSNVVKNGVVKKTEYNTLKDKVEAIDTSGFVTRTKFMTDTNALDDKIDKIEKKIPDISGLATKSSVTRLITEQEDYTDKVNKKFLILVV